MSRRLIHSELKVMTEHMATKCPDPAFLMMHIKSLENAVHDWDHELATILLQEGRSLVDMTTEQPN